MTKLQNLLLAAAIATSSCSSLIAQATQRLRPDATDDNFAKPIKWAVHCNEEDDVVCQRQRQVFREGLKALEQAVDSYQEGTRERARLQRAVNQILRGDGRQPAIAFASMLGSNATTSPDGKTLTFDVDSNAMNDARVAAGTIAEEGTHSADAHDPRRGSLSPFSFEYRGKQANAWAAQGAFGSSNGLAKVTRAGTEVVIWNPRTGHRATDEELKTQVLDGYNDGTNIYRETTPHDPWD